MKSEHRHQLQTNVLADQAGKAIEQAKPYTAMTMGGIALVAIIGIGLAFWHNSSEKANSSAWTDYYFANGRPDDLIPVYEDFPNSTAADWARQAEADSRMEQALDLVFRDRKQANELFEKALKSYEQIAKSASQPLLQARATFGLAQAYESIGDSEKATTAYKQLKQMETVTPAMATEVQRRLDWLQGTEAKSYFAWYKDYSPAPTAPLNLPPLGNLQGSPDMAFPMANPTNPAIPEVTAPSNAPPAPDSASPLTVDPLKTPEVTPEVKPNNDGAPQDK